VRVFRAAGTSFHLKAYLFAHFGADHALRGTAFIGSSNISRQALTDGLEWNYRVEYPGDDGFLEARARFEEIFRDPRTVPLSDDWIDAYEQRRIPPPRAIAPGSQEAEPPPVPTPIQAQALAALDATRRDGYRRLLGHFAPHFLLGLTATPDRTDQSDILSLCDDNLVFTRDLFAGIEAGLLAPFHYYGPVERIVRGGNGR
jgi:hypothetical protein